MKSLKTAEAASDESNSVKILNESDDELITNTAVPNVPPACSAEAVDDEYHDADDFTPNADRQCTLQFTAGVGPGVGTSGGDLHVLPEVFVIGDEEDKKDEEKKTEKEEASNLNAEHKEQVVTDSASQNVVETPTAQEEVKDEKALYDDNTTAPSTESAGPQPCSSANDLPSSASARLVSPHPTGPESLSDQNGLCTLFKKPKNP